MRMPLLAAMAALCLAHPADASPADNKAVARALIEQVLDQRDYALSPRIHTPDFRAHLDGGRTADLAADIAATKGWATFAPDYRMEVLHAVAEGDMVAVRWRFHGTNTGAGNGLPATGRAFDMTSVTFFRFENGKIAEEWSTIDQLKMMRQLGLMDAPPPK
jgi:steroid delta-isomerase-like uncharacterized protein